MSRTDIHKIYRRALDFDGVPLRGVAPFENDDTGLGEQRESPQDADENNWNH